MTTTAPIWELPDHERPVEGLDDRGAPDPAYAAALGLVSASLGRRAAAAAIDIGVFCLLQVPLVVLSVPLFRRLVTGRISWYGFVNHPDFLVSVVVAAVTSVLTILFVVAQLVMQGRWGFTLGKLATGLRAVDVGTLGRPGFWRTTWRALVAWLPVVTVLGTPLVLASPLWSRRERRRGWHDRAGRAWLVDVRHGLNPFDKKRMRVARKTITSAPAPRVRRMPSLATNTSGEVREEYRPGARTSAGVLGMARPHTGAERVIVGLTGFEPGESAPSSAEEAGIPRLGAYVVPAAPATGAPVLDGLGEASETPTPDRGERRHRAARPGRQGVARGSHSGDEADPRDHSSPDLGSTPGPGGSIEEPSSGPAASVTLLLDSGQRIQVSSPVVVGRSPESIGGAFALPIADPDFSISKTHAVLRPVAVGLEVIDQGSLNGTAVLQDGQEQPLTAGEVGIARFGDTVRIGERTARVLGS